MGVVGGDDLDDLDDLDDPDGLGGLGGLGGHGGPDDLAGSGDFGAVAVETAGGAYPWDDHVGPHLACKVVGLVLLYIKSLQDNRV